MKFAGIDVGLKKNILAVFDEHELIYLGKYREDVRFDVCGIDAPLDLPSKGSLRDCEVELIRMGIRLFPSGAEFFKPIALIGMELARKIRKFAEVYEVYPYATRKILGCNASKKRREGREKIKEFLSKFFKFDLRRNYCADELDAMTAALTVFLLKKGKAKEIGKECKIIIPLKL
uniref:DUF429 domain-containing protein n=1 Tax=Geoglobus ahangari TaxID=113653 RepID=A0A7C3YMU1_9EURY